MIVGAALLDDSRYPEYIVQPDVSILFLVGEIHKGELKDDQETQNR
jgi:hypothetical protein